MPDSKLKYQQLLVYAKQLPPLPPEMHTEEHKVRGCVSQVSSSGQQLAPQIRQTRLSSTCEQVWVVPTLRADGTIYWAADSDSALTKVLLALHSCLAQASLCAHCCSASLFSPLGHQAGGER